MNAITAHIPSALCQEFILFCIGTIKLELSAAPRVSAIVYIAIIEGTCLGKWRLINPGRSGPANAIPIPAIKAVISKNQTEFVKNLRIVPTPMTSSDHPNTRSIPHFPLNFTATGAKSPMQRTGIEVSKLATEAFISKLVLIVSSNGAIELIDGRKFNDAINKAIIIRIYFLFIKIHTLP